MFKALSVSIALLTIFSASSFGDVFMQDEINSEYAQATDKNYWNIVSKYDNKMDKLGEYVNNKYTPGSDMHQLYDNIKAIEGLTHSKNFGAGTREHSTASELTNPKSLVAYTDNLFALVCGAKVNYDDRQTGSATGKLVEGAISFGANHGLSKTRKFTQSDAQLYIAAMIHSRLTESAYNSDNLPTLDYMVHNTINSLSAADEQVRMHRLRLYAFQLLTGGIEYTINRRYGDVFKKPVRRTLADSKLVEDAWDNAIDFVRKHIVYAWRNANSTSITRTKTFLNDSKKMSMIESHKMYEYYNDKSNQQKLAEKIVATLNAYKEDFISLYTAISNKASDRKFLVYREVPDDIIEAKRRAKAAELKKAKDAAAENAGGLIDDNIIVGNVLEKKIREKKIVFELAKGSVELSFENPGGAGILQGALENLPKPVYSTIIEYSIVDKGKDIGSINNKYIESVLVGGKKSNKYLLMKAPNKTKEFVQKKAKLLQKPGVFMFSTQTPDVDGVYAYIPAKAMDNENTMFEMISAPLHGHDIKDSIGVKNPEYLKTIARSIHTFMTGDEAKITKKKKPAAPSIAPIVKDTKGLADGWETQSLSSLGLIVKSQLSNDNTYNTKKGENGYLKAYEAFETKDTGAGLAGKKTKTSNSVKVYKRVAIKISVADYNKLENSTFFGELNDFKGKKLGDLLGRNKGFLQVMGQHIFYITDIPGKPHKIYQLTSGDLNDKDQARLDEFAKSLHGTVKITLDQKSDNE